MATLVIKNFPDDLYEKLRAQAARHHRSVSSEAVMLIKAGLAGGPANVDVPPAGKPEDGPPA